MTHGQPPIIQPPASLTLGPPEEPAADPADGAARPAARASRDPEQRRTRRLLVTLVLTMLGLAVIGAAGASWLLYRSEYRDSQVSLDRFAHAVAEQTAWELRQIDTVLQLTRTWLGRADKLDPNSTTRLQERIQPRLIGLPAVQSVIVSNQGGTLRMVTRDSMAVPITGFDPRPLYAFYKEHPEADLTIGAPFRLAGVETWAFPLSRPILGKGGELLGAVTLVIDAPILAERYRLVRPAVDQRVALMRSDGMLLIDDAGLASVVMPSFVSIASPNLAGDGDRDDWIGTDGAPSLAHLRRVEDFPAVVAVSLPRELVGAKVRPGLLLISGVIALAAIALSAIVLLFGRRVLTTQANLRQQRDFVTRVLDSADVIVFVQDVTGRLIRCNAEAQKLGYATEELLSLDPFIHLVPREEHARAANARRRSRSGATPEPYECHLLTRQGEKRLIRWSTTEVPDANGRQNWVLSVGTDVTDERRQSAAIARNSAIMDHAQSIARMCYWTARPETASGDWTGWTFTYSANAPEVYGYEMEAIDVPLEQFVQRFVHSDDQAAMAERYREFYQGEDQRLAFTFRFKQTDGGYRYIRDFAEKRQDGGTLEIVGMSQNVTQQIASDALLRESEIKLRRAHRLAKLCYWTYEAVASSEDVDILVFSGDTDEIFGLSAEELNSATSSPLITMAHPEDRGRVVAEWRAFMQSADASRTFDYRLSRQDGEIRDVSVSAEKVMNEQGLVGQVVGVVQDITDRRRSEIAMARNEDLLRHAHRLTRIGYWVWEPRDVAQSSDRGWLHVSTEFSDILGVAPDGIPLEETDLVRKFGHPEDRDTALAAVESFVTRTADRYSVKFRAVKPSGEVIHIHMDAERIRDAQGNILYEVGVAQDVTEQRQREMELMTAKRAAEIANRTKTQFLANMSHELRTPLNAVIGFSQIIKDQAFGEIPERYLNYADDINSSGKLLLALINDILDMSRIEAGQHKLTEEVISIEAAINDCVRMVAAKAADGGVRLAVENKGKLPPLRADERALKQVLLNVLSNAVKFTPQGGAVTIAAQRLPDGRVEVQIADTGIGIAEDALKELFQPFRQADASISRRFGGTGLGLAISKKLVELHGGEIQVDSDPGRGTRVILRLPADRVMEQPAGDRRMQA